MKNLPVFMLLCLLWPKNMAAQAVYFSRQFDPLPNSAEVGVRLTTLPEGYAFTTLQGPADDPKGCMLLITDNEGNLVHQKQMLPSTNAIAGLSYHAADSSFFLWGDYYAGAQDYVPYLLKTSFWGDTIWVKEYNLPFFDYCRHAVELPDGGFLLCGSTRLQPLKVCYCRVDNTGNLLWARTFSDGFLGYDTYGLVWQNDSTAFVGYNGKKISVDSLHPPYDGYGLLEIDPDDGQVRRDTFFLTPFWVSDPWTGWLVRTTDGKMAFVNRTTSSDQDGRQWINGTDTTFHLLWQHYPSDLGFPSYIASITTNQKGNIVGCGLLASDNLWPWIFEMTPDGALVWERIARPPVLGQWFNPGSVFDFVRPAPDGGYVLTGTFLTHPDNEYEAWLIKLDSLGCAEPGCQTGNSLTVDAPEPSVLPEKLRCSPNPANESVCVVIDGERGGRLRLLDLKGIRLGDFSIAGEKTVLPTQALSNGIYWLQWIDDNGRLRAARKIAVVH